MALANMSTHLSLATLLLLLVLPMALCGGGEEKVTVLDYYILQEFKYNRTLVVVAGVQGEKWSPENFASIYVTDLRVVKEPSLNATEVGRVEGLLVAASKNGIYDFQTSATRFMNEKYNGSSLVTAGVFSTITGKVDEFSVVGGTGKFKGAKGIGILTILEQTYSYTISSITYKFTRSGFEI